MRDMYDCTDASKQFVSHMESVIDTSQYKYDCSTSNLLRSGFGEGYPHLNSVDSPPSPHIDLIFYSLVFNIYFFKFCSKEKPIVLLTIAINSLFCSAFIHIIHIMRRRLGICKMKNEE